MGSHTPGPWIYGVRNDGSIWVSLGNPERGEHHQYDFAGKKDDARLFVSAPDLLAALKAILPMAENGAAKPGHDGFCGPEQSCDCECMYAAYDSERLYQARAAIRKAEGEGIA